MGVPAWYSTMKERETVTTNATKLHSKLDEAAEVNIDCLVVPTRLTNNSRISGLQLEDNYVDRSLECSLVNSIDARDWIRERRGRVQNYGYLFNYNTGNIDNFSSIKPIPSFIQELGQGLVDRGFFKSFPECVIINEYTPGQGIVPHIDVIEHFGPQVVTISLLADINMVFIKNMERDVRFELPLPARSLLLLDGEARFDWMHGIRARKTDNVDGQGVQRERRISISFRNIKPDFIIGSTEDLDLFEGKK